MLEGVRGVFVLSSDVTHERGRGFRCYVFVNTEINDYGHLKMLTPNTRNHPVYKPEASAGGGTRGVCPIIGMSPIKVGIQVLGVCHHWNKMPIHMIKCKHLTHKIIWCTYLVWVLEGVRGVVVLSWACHPWEGEAGLRVGLQASGSGMGAGWPRLAPGSCSCSSSLVDLQRGKMGGGGGRNKVVWRWVSTHHFYS